MTFHINKPTEVRLVAATKSLIAPPPEPILYRSIAEQRVAFVIETMPSADDNSCHRHIRPRPSCARCCAFESLILILSGRGCTRTPKSRGVTRTVAQLCVAGTFYEGVPKIICPIIFLDLSCVKFVPILIEKG